MHTLIFVFFLKATEVKMNEVEFNPQFVSRMIPKLEWSALVQAADEVRQTDTVLDHSRETWIIVDSLPHISV